MKIAHPLLLLLAFGLTHKTYASQREKAVKKAFEELAVKEAARCLQEGQDSRPICSRAPIQIEMEKQKKKAEEFKAQIDPVARILMEISKREAAEEREAGRAYVGGSVVIKCNRNEISGAQGADQERRIRQSVSLGQNISVNQPRPGVSHSRPIDVTKRLAEVLRNPPMRPADRFGAISVPPHRARL